MAGQRRTAAIWAGICLTAALAAWLFPPARSVGYPASWWHAVWLSAAAGHLAAGYPAAVRAQLAPYPGARATLARLYWYAARWPLALLGLFLGITGAAGLIHGACDWPSALAHVALGPVAATLVAVAAGLLAGTLFSGRAAQAAWWLFYAATTVHSAWRLYDGAAFFAVHPLWGYFRALVYETTPVPLASLAWWRAAHVLTAVLVLWAVSPLLCKERLLVRVWPSVRSAARWIAVIPFLAAALWAPAPWGGPATHADLDRRFITARVSALTIRYSPAIPASARRNYSEEAAFAARRIQAALGMDAVRGTVYVFASEQERYRWIGARRVSLARPWRRTAYVVVTPRPAFPDATLRHELTHVAAASWGRGPFAVPGALGGLVPRVGIAEGLATMVADDPDTLHRRAAAMEHRKRLPSVDALMGARFFSTASSLSYTASGSLLHFVATTFGRTALRRLYQTGDVSDALGLSVGELDRRWRAFLDGVAVPDATEAWARFLFDRPPVIHAHCPGVTDEISRRARRAERDGACAQAAALWRRALTVSRSATDVALAAWESAALCGKNRPSPSAEDPVRALFAAEFRRDLALLRRRWDQVRYDDLAQRAITRGDQRRLAIKSHLWTTLGTAARPLLLALSPHPTVAARTPGVAAAVASAALRAPQDPAVIYLVNRLLFLRDAMDAVQVDRLAALASDDRMSCALGEESLYVAMRAAYWQGRFETAAALLRRGRRIQCPSAGTPPPWSDWNARIGERRTPSQ